MEIKEEYLDKLDKISFYSNIDNYEQDNETDYLNFQMLLKA